MTTTGHEWPRNKNLMEKLPEKIIYTSASFSIIKKNIMFLTLSNGWSNCFDGI
jgi:hypothetical protein